LRRTATDGNDSVSDITGVKAPQTGHRRHIDMAVNHLDTIAFVTGGSQGLGHAVAQRLIGDGCTGPVFGGRDVPKGTAAAKSQSALGAEVVFVAAETGDPAQAMALTERAADRFGDVTALVNAAAVTDRPGILECTPAEWDRQMAADARGPFLAIQRLACCAIAAGHGASVVNILSVAAQRGQSFLAPFVASRAALLNVTKNAANALARNRIRVNGVNIGWMETLGEDTIQRRWRDAPPDWLARAKAAKPVGSLVKPQSVAGLVSHLLSDDAGVMTGAIIDFDQHIAGACPE